MKKLKYTFFCEIRITLSQFTSRKQTTLLTQEMSIVCRYPRNKFKSAKHVCSYKILKAQVRIIRSEKVDRQGQ